MPYSKIELESALQQARAANDIEAVGIITKELGLSPIAPAPVPSGPAPLTKAELPFADRPNLIPLPLEGPWTQMESWVAPRWMAAMAVPGKVALGEPVSLGEVQELAGLGTGRSLMAPGPRSPRTSRTLASYFPWTEARTGELAHQELQKLAGGPENLAALYAEAIKGRASAVPGYTRDLGQAIARDPRSTAVLAKMQDASRKPGLSYKAEQAREANSKALASYANQVGAGTPEAVKVAEQAAADNAAIAYRDAYAVRSGSEDFDKVLATPAGKSAVRTATTAALNRSDPQGLAIPGSADPYTPTQYPGEMQNQIVQILNEQAQDMFNRGSQVGGREVRGVEQRAVSALKDINPALIAAREGFQRDMVPVNRMKLLQLIAQTVQESGASAATGAAAEARLTQAATGGHHRAFNEVLTPEQQEYVRQMTDEFRLAERAQTRQAATGAIPETRSPLERVARSAMSQDPTSVALKRGIEFEGGFRNKRVAEALLNQYLNPQQFISPRTPTLAGRVGQAPMAVQLLRDRPVSYGFGREQQAPPSETRY